MSLAQLQPQLVFFFSSYSSYPSPFSSAHLVFFLPMCAYLKEYNKFISGYHSPLRYAWNMSMMKQRFTENMLKICMTYALHTWQKVSPVTWGVVHKWRHPFFGHFRLPHPPCHHVIFWHTPHPHDDVIYNSENVWT